MGMFSLLLTISMGYRLASIWKSDKLISALVCVVSFIIVTPHTFTQIVAKQPIVLDSAMQLSYFGTSGVITALIVTTFVALIFAKLSNNDKLRIKMPDSVPESVTRSFEALIPITITRSLVGLLA